MNPATGREPRLLDDVVHLAPTHRAEQPQHDHAKPRGVPQVQLAKRGLVAAEEPTDQRRVSEIGELASAGHTV